MLGAISVRFEIEPEHVDAYWAAARPVIEATRQEAGCRLYAFAQDIEQANVVWISEEWDDDQALQAHLETEHVRNFRAYLQNITFLSRDVRKYSVAKVGSV